MEQRTILVGKGSILVESEHFINGYQAGSLAYRADQRRYIITNQTVTTVLIEKLENPDIPEQYGIGYCVGWIVALATKEPWRAREHEQAPSFPGHLSVKPLQGTLEEG